VRGITPSCAAASTRGNGGEEGAHEGYEEVRKARRPSTWTVRKRSTSKNSVERVTGIEPA
jgi:hypothetical protein